MINYKTLIFSALAAMLLGSCSRNIYQVYDVQSDLKQTENSLVYSNDECEITYNLWGESGSLSFLASNKTDNDIFIVLAQSFFIRNGIAYDYYTEGSESFTRLYSSSANESATAMINGYLQNGGKWGTASAGYIAGKSHSQAFSKSHTVVDPKFICIPAHSTKLINSFSISNYSYIECGNKAQNYPNKQSATIHYSKSNSPLIFRNRIAYTFDTANTLYKYIDNGFYVSSLTNYSKKAAMKNISEKDCNTGITFKREKFTIDAPNRFYNVYHKKM